jgi:hypothetical protein
LTLNFSAAHRRIWRPKFLLVEFQPLGIVCERSK